MATPESGLSGRGRLRQHLSDPLYRTGYYLILGTGVTSLLGVAFWALAAHSYSARVVGLNAAAISAMTLVAEACTLGLSAVLVRYLPVAGGSTRRLVSRSYAVTISLALAFGLLAALTSGIWSPQLSFLSGWWLAGRLRPRHRGDDRLHPPGQRPHRPQGGEVDPAGERALRAGQAAAADRAGDDIDRLGAVRRLDRAARLRRRRSSTT